MEGKTIPSILIDQNRRCIDKRIPLPVLPLSAKSHALSHMAVPAMNIPIKENPMSGIPKESLKDAPQREIVTAENTKLRDPDILPLQLNPLVGTQDPNAGPVVRRPKRSMRAAHERATKKVSKRVSKPDNALVCEQLSSQLNVYGVLLEPPVEANPPIALEPYKSYNGPRLNEVYNSLVQNEYPKAALHSAPINIPSKGMVPDFPPMETPAQFLPGSLEQRIPFYESQRNGPPSYVHQQAILYEPQISYEQQLPLYGTQPLPQSHEQQLYPPQQVLFCGVQRQSHELWRFPFYAPRSCESQQIPWYGPQVCEPQIQMPIYESPYIIFPCLPHLQNSLQLQSPIQSPIHNEMQIIIQDKQAAHPYGKLQSLPAKSQMWSNTMDPMGEPYILHTFPSERYDNI